MSTISIRYIGEPLIEICVENEMGVDLENDIALQIVELIKENGVDVQVSLEGECFTILQLYPRKKKNDT